MVSAFENATTEVQYDYIEDIHDGRGYTAGKAGFTTATGDLWEVVRIYGTRTSNSVFHPVEDILKERAEKESASLEGLHSLPRLWRKACEDDVFITVQDDLVVKMYKAPARKYLAKYKLNSELAYLVFYDSLIQQGDGSDPDSFSGIIKKMSARPGDEKEFLTTFLEAREQILTNPTNQDTKDEWRKSVDRVKALRRLLSDENWNLKVPFTLKVWGQRFTVK